LLTGKFLQYDYGLKENIIHYNSATPPAYNLSKITVPIKFYHGKNDILANVVVSITIYNNNIIIICDTIWETRPYYCEK